MIQTTLDFQLIFSFPIEAMDLEAAAQLLLSLLFRATELIHCLSMNYAFAIPFISTCTAMLNSFSYFQFMGQGHP